MPYAIRHTSQGYCVIKQDTGNHVACHPTRAKAARHLRALYANVPDAVTEKANYGARAGQVIAGNLARGGDGKFTSAGNASASKKKPPTQSYGAKRLPKAARRSVLAKRRTSGGKGKTGTAKKPAGGKTQTPPAQRELEQLQLEAARNRAADRKQRLAERAQDRAQRAADRMKRDVEKVNRQAQQQAHDKKREQEKQQRKAEVERRRAKREDRQGKGGGGKSKPDKAAEQAKARIAVQAATLDKSAFDAFTSVAEGGDADTAQLEALTNQGLLEKDTSGGYRVSEAGRSYLLAANRGDVGRARDALSRAKDRAAKRTKETPSFAVFKQANGRLRWITVSSTAFRDRDGEIVSIQALKDACLYADATGHYGPLRWWHMPGLDIGDCDFNMVVGRSLVESGTFRNERIGALVAQKAVNHQISIGFLHPRNQPDEDGVFTRIYKFERSLTPAGRASNPFTRLVVKDTTMTDQEKLAAFKELVGDDDILKSLFADIVQSEKAADAQGVAFKSTEEQLDVAEKADGEEAPADAMPMDDGAEESILTDMELDAIADRVVAKLAPLLQGASQKEAKESAVLATAVKAVNAKADEAKKVAADASTSLADLATTIKDYQAKIAELEKMEARLKELEGDQPRGYGFWASRAKETETTNVQTPKADPLTAQLDFIVGPAA